MGASLSSGSKETLGIVPIRSELDLLGALADGRTASTRLVLRLMGDVPVNQTLIMDRSSTVLDLNGFSLVASESADPVFRFYNGVPLSDLGILTAVTPGSPSGALQDVELRDGFIYVGGENFCQLNGSRIFLRNLNIVGSSSLFVDSTGATRSYSSMRGCTWGPSSQEDFDLPAGMRISDLTCTDTHGEITLPAMASIQGSRLDGAVILSGDGAMVTGCHLGDGVIDFTASGFNKRNVSGCVRTGAGSGATVQAQDSYTGNN